MLFSDSIKIWKKKPNTDKSTTAGEDGQKQTDCKYHSYEKIPVLPKSRDQHFPTLTNSCFEAMFGKCIVRSKKLTQLTSE